MRFGAEFSPKWATVAASSAPITNIAKRSMSSRVGLRSGGAHFKSS